MLHQPNRGLLLSVCFLFVFSGEDPDIFCFCLFVFVLFLLCMINCGSIGISMGSVGTSKDQLRIDRGQKGPIGISENQLRINRGQRGSMGIIMESIRISKDQLRTNRGQTGSIGINGITNRHLHNCRARSKDCTVMWIVYVSVMLSRDVMIRGNRSPRYLIGADRMMMTMMMMMMMLMMMMMMFTTLRNDL